MGQIVDPEGRVCEQTKWHSRQKHAFLEEYLDIWSNQVGTDGKSKLPTLDIFDLYASFGFCYCPEEKKTWMGSALLAAECLKKYQSGKLLFLNTYHPDENELRAQKKSLENGLSNIHLPERVRTVIESLPIEKAVEFVISHVNPNYPSLWILEGSYQAGNRKITRRPELFICLMTGRLQRLTGIDKEKEKVGTALGMEENIWKAKLENYRDSDDNTRRALISIYAEKIAETISAKNKMQRKAEKSGHKQLFLE
jgi:hypothetical protein